jgi:signal transduction histidine kinase
MLPIIHLFFLFMTRFCLFFCFFYLNISSLFAQNFTIADSLFKNQQFDKALLAYEQIPMAGLSEREKRLVQVNKAKCLFTTQNFPKIVNDLRDLVAQNTADSAAYEANVAISRAYLQLGQLDSARLCVEVALRLQGQYAPLSIGAFDAAKGVYVALSEYDKAFKVSFEGLKIAERTQKKLAISVFYLHIGDMYWLRKEHRKAIEIYRESLSKIEKDVTPKQVRSHYFGLANCYLAENQLDSAAYFFQKNYESIKKEGDPWGIAAALAAYGFLYESQNDYPKAIAYYEQAIPYYQKSKQASGLAQAYENLANSHSHNGANGIALKYALLATDIADSLKNKLLMTSCYSTLSHIYANKGDYKRAFEVHNQYSILVDSLFSAEKMKITEETAARYEAYKKDQQIIAQKLGLLENQKTITQVVLGGVIVLLSLLLGFLLYRRQQQQHIKQLESTFEQVTQQLQSFNYSVSHDLQNPLIVAQNALNELKNPNPKTDPKQAIQKAEKSILTMQQIIGGMLALSEVERMSLKLKEVNTKDLVTDILSELPNTPSVELGNLPTVKADIALLRQVFSNLISNAIKYSAKSAHPTLKIDAHTEGGQTVFNITDNGIGFPPQYAGKLFKLFGRLHPEYQGIGVGLVIVKKIVEKHGGEVWANTKTGEGAVFSFSLPQV